MKNTSIILAATIAASPFLLAKKTGSSRTGVLSPEEELAGFKLPEGFIIELVASEKDGIINPIDLTFDDAGRLWTQTAEMYPLDPVADIPWNKLLKLMEHPEEQQKVPEFKRILDLYQGKTKGKDKILILSNLYGSKQEAKVDVWADGLAIPQSILPHKNGAFVAQGSELFALSDTNNDGKADKRTPILTGFGFTDTHTMAHLLVRGPGNWIHFSHGALNKGEVTAVRSGQKTRIDYCKIARYSLDGEQLELVSSGLQNIWGFTLRNNGQWYGTEANDMGWSIVPMEPGTGFRGIGNDRIRPYQPWMPAPHSFRVGGTGISGAAFADDSSGSFPPAWKDVAFLANPITSKINAVRIARNPDGTITAKHLPDLLTSDDDWFRPVNIEFGPDGCLYIADWYNKIISHNELPTTHPDRDKKHGRIWRIRHVSQKAREVPNMYKVSDTQLVNHLLSDSLWEKRAAWHQISDRKVTQAAPALVAMAADRNRDVTTRIHALWSLEGIAHYDSTLISNLLKEDDGDLRREAVRSLASFSLKAGEVAALLSNHIHDDNVMVRSQALRTLSEINQADANSIHLLVAACRPELPGLKLGGSYERSFERYLARMALEKYPSELQQYLGTEKAKTQPVSHLLWASQALPEKEREIQLLRIWQQAKIEKLDDSTFIAVSQLLSSPAVFKALTPVFEDPKHAQHTIKLALKHQNQVQSPELSRILQKSTNHLLEQQDSKDQQRGLEAVGRLKIPNQHDAIIAIFKNPASSDAMKRLCLQAMEHTGGKNKDLLADLLKDKSTSFGLKKLALASLAKQDSKFATRVTSDLLSSINPAEKSDLVSTLSASPQGGGILLQLLSQKQLKESDFTLSQAERIHQSHRKNKQAKSLLADMQVKAKQEKAQQQETLKRFITIADKKGGDPVMGKPLFTALCLSCHAVGDEGAGFAPALDGSAHRDNEALLTAILDPDAAMEGNYTLYRVTKKDGSTLEGYLEKKDERGSTLRFMGGSSAFISASDIRSQGFVNGRSVMPKGLIDNMDEQSVANLLAYIRTLK
ncbi:c-type cytochrome [Verrucomicrobiaceae bacterium N1E253]|uniref:C-type cytochrome n=1 Tax=Oceaniferula marina TaxID=2748318 RepID=A0A851GDP7_9BACT|nr:HEAT repeat domain-containing protein [Oceaniferula marina]NWK55289.1 c-type cytochrome [Oceaniferula marina]